MRRTVRPALGLAILTVALTLALAACGIDPVPPFDTSAPSLSITSQTSATSASYHLTGKASDNVGATKITYSVDGGPTKTVDLSGGSFDVTVTLQAGQNTIDVKAYDAAGNDKEVVFHVTYTPPGQDSLSVSVTGLPTGTDASVTVSGPAGYSQTVTGTTTLTGLADGGYTVAATGVSAGGTSYHPNPASQTLSLSGGQTGHATVSYASASTATGSLTVTVSGLPGGANGDVTVTGPGGYSQTVQSTQTLSGLTPGTYTVTPNAVTINLVYWQGTATPSSVDVGAGTTATSDVTYQAIYGFLKIDVSGVPSGHSANVSVTGPGGYSNSVSATTTLNGLVPGSYGVAAPDISDSATGDVYAGTVVGSPADVQPGATATVTVSYARATDHLSIDVSGLPSGASPAIGVTGPGGYSTQVTSSGTTLLTGLADGTYALTASNVSAGGSTYVSNPSARSVPLSGGQNGSASFVYAVQSASTGDLTVNVAGLLNSTAADVAVSGPAGYSQTVTGTTTLTGLAAGTYTLTVHDVSGTLYDFSGSASAASVDVPAGGSASSDVAYHATSGALDSTVTGLPSGTDAAVRLVPYPSGTGTSYTIHGSGTLGHLIPGDYAFLIDAVTGTDQELYNDVVDRGNLLTITIHAGQTASQAIPFEQVSGDIHVTITGVQTGAVVFQASGSKTPNVAASTSTTLKGVWAGPTTYGTTYTTAVADVLENGYTWSGTATPSSVTVVRGQTTDVVVDYTTPNGTLVVNESGLPSGVDADMDVSAYMGLQFITGETGSFTTDLQAGAYTLGVRTVTGPVFDYGLNGNLPSGPGTIDFTITGGQTSTVDVVYAAYDGAIAASLSGAIPVASYQVTLTDGSTTTTLASSKTVPHLATGTYTVTAPTYSIGKCATAPYTVTTYTPTITPSSVTVTKGVSAPLKVVYSSATINCQP